MLVSGFSVRPHPQVHWASFLLCVQESFPGAGLGGSYGVASFPSLLQARQAALLLYYLLAPRFVEVAELGDLGLNAADQIRSQVSHMDPGALPGALKGTR